jgi:hypothetical protein
MISPQGAFRDLFRCWLLACVRFLLLGAAISVVGCGGRGPQVNGKVVLPKDAHLQPDDEFQVTLTAADRSEAGKIEQSDLTFVIKGADGHGVQPGKYKVEIICRPYRGHDSANARTHKEQLDKVFGPFSGKKNVLPEVDIPSGSTVSLTIDLDKRTVTR